MKHDFDTKTSGKEGLQERIHKILVGGCSFELGWMLTEYKDVSPGKGRK